MIEAYPVEQVADKYLPHMKDRVRWMKRRLKKGEIPGKQLSRSVWVMTDAHIEQWLSGGPPVAHQEPVEPVSLVDGLSARSRRRLAAS
ncbi:excisionase [Mycobacterium phage MKC-IRE-02]